MPSPNVILGKDYKPLISSPKILPTAGFRQKSLFYWKSLYPDYQRTICYINKD
jgi:hypothetical protein